MVCININNYKKQKFLKIDVEVGMKKAQKQEIIHDERDLEFSTHSYISHGSMLNTC